MQKKLSPTIIGIIFGLCVLPVILMALGINLSFPNPYIIQNGTAPSHSPNIEFTHVVFDTISVCLGAIIMVISFLHYRMTKTDLSLILSVAFLCSGIIDVCHTFAFLYFPSHSYELINFTAITWMASKTVTISILIVGVVTLYYFDSKNKKLSLSTIYVVTAILVSMILAAIYFLADSQSMFNAIFPGQFIKRPYELIPLILFLIAGLVVFPKFYAVNKKIFVFALFIFLIPEISSELYLLFGSEQLNDSAFNSAHFIKIVSYTVPLIAQAIDYIETHQNQKGNLSKAKTFAQALADKSSELVKRNKELDRFNYVVSHDLKSPLRAIGSLVHWLEIDLPDATEEVKENIRLIKQRTIRLDNFINGLLEYSKIGRTNIDKTDVDISILLKE